MATSADNSNSIADLSADLLKTSRATGLAETLAACASTRALELARARELFPPDKNGKSFYQEPEDVNVIVDSPVTYNLPPTPPTPTAAPTPTPPPAAATSSGVGSGLGMVAAALGAGTIGFLLGRPTAQPATPAATPTPVVAATPAAPTAATPVPPRTRGSYSLVPIQSVPVKKAP